MTNEDKLNHLKEVLSFDDRMVLMSLINTTVVPNAYRAGFINGVKAFAWWRDGEQYCGTSGTKLKDVKSAPHKIYGYAPEWVDYLLDHPEQEKSE